MRQTGAVPAAPRFCVLGPLAVHTVQGPVPPGPPLRRAVLALLLAHPHGSLSIEQLTTQLWADHPPPSARAQIQNHICALRKALGNPELLLTQAPGYLLQVPPSRRDDLAFRADVAEGRAARAGEPPGAAATALARGLRRWRGPAYEGIDLPAVRAAASLLDQLRLDIVEEWAEASLSAGIIGDVVDLLTAEIGRQPLRERMRALLMQALDRTGRRADALQVFREGRAVLAEELGVEPGPTLQALHLGLLGGSEPIGSPRPGPLLLPPDLQDLTGREDLAADCLRQLSERSVLCLSGPAGIGKTALAVHLAHRGGPRFPGGRILARFGDDPRALARVLATCLRSLGVSDAALPDAFEDQAALLRERLADRAVLIVLDGVAGLAQVRPFLPDAGRSALIVTSRLRLDGLDGSGQREVPLLSEPAALRVLAGLAGRARIDADPEASRELAGYCGGFPLALRIAGARLAARPGWTVADLAARLAEESSRLDWLRIGDRAVRTALQATCAQLAPEERVLFRRLGALPVRDFPSWVAVALLDAAVAPAELALDRLVEAHLVEPAGRDSGGLRWRMHDLLRLFARELAEAEDAPTDLLAARTRAYDGWLALAQAAGNARPGKIARDPEPSPRWEPPAPARAAAGADPAGWFVDECAAALVVVREAADAGLARIAWPLAQRLIAHLDQANRVADWDLVANQALAAAERQGEVRGQACMLRYLVDSQRIRGHLDAALNTGLRCMQLYQEVDPAWAVAAAGVRLGIVHQVRGELDRAEELGARAVDAARRIGEPALVANALHLGGAVRSVRGDSQGGLTLIAQALTAYEAAGCDHGAAAIQSSIGLLLKRLGRYPEARTALTGAQRMADRLGDRSMRAHCDSCLAEVLAEQGEHEDALALARPAVHVQHESGDRHALAVSLTALGVVTDQALGPAAALPVLEEAVRAWQSAGSPSPATLRRLLSALRSAGDDDLATGYQADLERLTGGS